MHSSTRIKASHVPDGVTQEQYSRHLRSIICAIHFIIDSARHAVDLPDSDLKGIRADYVRLINGDLDEMDFTEGIACVTLALEVDFKEALEVYEEARG